jgi:hypothetical protein
MAHRLLAPAARRDCPEGEASRATARTICMIVLIEAVHGKAGPMSDTPRCEDIMAFSLDTPSAATLKAEAKILREERAGAGAPLSHSAALEEVARRHGYRDWNTARAALPERIAVPVQAGERVAGTYLGQPFAGLVLGVRIKGGGGPFEVIVRFDQPVNVSRSVLLGPIHRSRVTATVDPRGVSPSQTSDGEPHLRLRRVRPRA